MKRLMLWIASGCMCISTFAYGSSYYDSQLMHVQITNQTASKCQLKSQEIQHGHYVSYPPQVLLPDNSQSFEIAQYFSSHSIVLDYQCGTSEAQFEVYQGYTSIFHGPTPYVNILKTNNLVVETGPTSPSSWYWNNEGMISIILK